MSLTAETTESVRATRAWQAAFIEMAPTIERYARVAFRKLAPEERDEAVQTTLAAAAVDYARLAASGRGGRAYPTTLARFAVRRYRAGRLLGSRDNAADVGSRKWRLRGRRTESIDVAAELCDCRHATPAELAALRIDFGQWFASLPVRDQRVVHALAQGERTSVVAALCQLTAGRVSQLRRELYDSWMTFLGEGAPRGA
ncbi:hypothetical protein [Lacipirellula limnantheis]|uniref:Uncharacterized protein n=1 Tax=Lacipirellula limnantheis TaxID=2528024 RepID=A0A517TVW8_9BACT|nr:hypothetical protein [Lacipirellula limnantheis]QDT72518.1 hypothetical protein I41_16980 [Lacipirellula limnantheis]